MGWIRINLDFPILWAFPESLFRAGGVLASFQAFINVYKHYGSIAVDLDPRSKIQDYRKNFLDPRSGSKKFFLESWILDLGSRPWIQEVFPRILDLGSWIQISCYGSIAFINVCKHHLKNHSKNAQKKGPQICQKHCTYQ